MLEKGLSYEFICGALKQRRLSTFLGESVFEFLLGLVTANRVLFSLWVFLHIELSRESLYWLPNNNFVWENGPYGRRLLTTMFIRGRGKWRVVFC